MLFNKYSEEIFTVGYSTFKCGPHVCLIDLFSKNKTVPPCLPGNVGLKEQIALSLY